MALPATRLAFRKYLERGLSSVNDVTLGITGGKLGFFGKTTVTKPTALTAANASAVGATYTATEQAVLTNTRTRVNELETKLKDLGLIS